MHHDNASALQGVVNAAAAAKAAGTVRCFVLVSGMCAHPINRCASELAPTRSQSSRLQATYWCCSWAANITQHCIAVHCIWHPLFISVL